MINGKKGLLAKRSLICFILMSVLSLSLIIFLLLHLKEPSQDFILLFFVALSAFFAVVMCYIFIVLVPFFKTAEIIRNTNPEQGINNRYIRRYLSDDVYGLIDKLHTLLSVQTEIKESKKQAEYLAIQNQINPHFLYNTLEAIRGDALGAGMDTIANMTETLANFFRYTISTTESLVTLEDELGNIENYFTIQRYRFGEKLKYSIKNNGDTLHYKLPKMILQPIVENAIYHGIERKIDSGVINIIIEATRTRLIINIIDDGVGFEQNKLDALNEKLALARFSSDNEPKRQRTGIGLTNVNNRIKMLFGEEYGVRISSSLGVGTDAEITLPLKTV